MNLEHQVVSLELAKRLNELGVKQDNLFYWIKLENSKEVEIFGLTFVTNMFQEKSEFREIYSAFTVAELGEMLPDDYLKIKVRKVRGAKSSETEMKDYWLCYNDIDGIDNNSTQMEIIEEDARAKMIIYLIENRLMEVKDKE